MTLLSTPPPPPEPDAVKEEQFLKGSVPFPQENGTDAEQDGGERAREKCLYTRKNKRKRPCSIEERVGKA